jgi:hypothetical protein
MIDRGESGRPCGMTACNYLVIHVCKGLEDAHRFAMDIGHRGIRTIDDRVA